MLVDIAELIAEVRMMINVDEQEEINGKSASRKKSNHCAPLQDVREQSGEQEGSECARCAGGGERLVLLSFSLVN